MARRSSPSSCRRSPRPAERSRATRRSGGNPAPLSGELVLADAIELALERGQSKRNDQGQPHATGAPMHRSDTQSISIDARREAVLDLVSDPTAFPRWASGFALAVRVDGRDWLVDTSGGEVRLR